MSEDLNNQINNTIYRDFCNGMKNQAREQIRLSGEIARRITKPAHPSKASDTLGSVGINFCQIEAHLENIENNLNKVNALTRQSR